MSKKEEFANNLKSVFGNLDVSSMEKAADDLLKKVNPLFKQIEAEQMKLNKPKSKKNTKWEGSNISVSLIEDGRVLITFPELDKAESFYNCFENISPNKLEEEKKLSNFYHQEGLKTASRYTELLRLYNIEISKKWYHKLFGK